MVECNLSSILKDRKLGITKVSKDTGLSRTTLNSLVKGYSDGVSFKVLDTLCNYLNVDIGDLLSVEKEEDTIGTFSKIYVARMVISFFNSWDFNFNFNIIEESGVFKLNDLSKHYEKDNSKAHYPSYKVCKESSNTLEVVQCFAHELSEDEKIELKNDMKNSILSLLDEYRDAYLRSYGKKSDYVSSLNF